MITIQPNLDGRVLYINVISSEDRLVPSVLDKAIWVRFIEIKTVVGGGCAYMTNQKLSTGSISS